MVKYNSVLKAQIINEHLNDGTSGAELARNHQLPKRQVNRWLQQYRLNGIETLKWHKTKRKFSAEFKWNVINYYQTHDESLAEVAGKYNVLACQICTWRKTFIRDGYSGLGPHPKGRPTKMKRSKKQIRQLEKQSELERLRNELAKKNQELYATKLENDILKKSMTLFGPSKDVKKPK
ncbi:transposase [Pediococcus pentosaceus]|uniref:transposase n=3 Tax=Lactobacillaceae TaxID=33958 RepID=UPI0020CF2208|nr:transposase [Pediococcus acidilactici]MCQ0053606.1 transposase [Pediococcus acidilactici]